jgi:hypothetical protein
MKFLNESIYRTIYLLILAQLPVACNRWLAETLDFLLPQALHGEEPMSMTVTHFTRLTAAR